MFLNNLKKKNESGKVPCEQFDEEDDVQEDDEEQY